MSDTHIKKLSKVEYVIEGGDLLTPVRGNPELEALRQEVVTLKERLSEALDNRPDALEPLDESQVPSPIGESTRNCVSCSYGKMVNFQIIDHWETQQRGSCPDECGVKLNCETVVENGMVKKDIVECWELWKVNVEI